MNQPATNDIHGDKILILDFGAQYTQLIARRIREIGVYCEIWAWDHDPAEIAAFGAKGIILSGGPESTTEAGAPVAPQQVLQALRVLDAARTSARTCKVITLGAE